MNKYIIIGILLLVILLSFLCIDGYVKPGEEKQCLPYVEVELLESKICKGYNCYDIPIMRVEYGKSYFPEQENTCYECYYYSNEFYKITYQLDSIVLSNGIKLQPTFLCGSGGGSINTVSYGVKTTSGIQFYTDVIDDEKIFFNLYDGETIEKIEYVKWSGNINSKNIPIFKQSKESIEKVYPDLPCYAENLKLEKIVFKIPNRLVNDTNQVDLNIK